MMNYPTALKSLNQLSQVLPQAKTLDQLLWSVTSRCAQFLHLEDFVVYTFKKNESTLIQVANLGAKRKSKQLQLSPFQIPIGKGIVGLSAYTRQPYLVEDTSTEANYLIDDQRRLSELAVPIIWKKKVIGVIDSEHPNKRFFSDLHLDVFCLISSLCAPLMDQLLRKELQYINADNKYYNQLIHLLEEDKIYRDKDLSLNNIAQVLGISPVYLSTIINQISKASFVKLINKYRIEEVKTLIKKGQHREYNILSLAYQAGFNSKSSFNHNFKLYTRLTPSEYIRKNES